MRVLGIDSRAIGTYSNLQPILPAFVVRNPRAHALYDKCRQLDDYLVAPGIDRGRFIIAAVSRPWPPERFRVISFRDIDPTEAVHGAYEHWVRRDRVRAVPSDGERVGADLGCYRLRCGMAAEVAALVLGVGSGRMLKAGEGELHAFACEAVAMPMPMPDPPPVMRATFPTRSDMVLKLRRQSVRKCHTSQPFARPPATSLPLPPPFRMRASAAAAEPSAGTGRRPWSAIVRRVRWCVKDGMLHIDV